MPTAKDSRGIAIINLTAEGAIMHAVAFLRIRIRHVNSAVEAFRGMAFIRGRPIFAPVLHTTLVPLNGVGKIQVGRRNGKGHGKDDGLARHNGRVASNYFNGVALVRRGIAIGEGLRVASRFAILFGVLLRRNIVSAKRRSYNRMAMRLRVVSFLRQETASLSYLGIMPNLCRANSKGLIRRAPPCRPIPIVFPTPKLAGSVGVSNG